MLSSRLDMLCSNAFMTHFPVLPISSYGSLCKDVSLIKSLISFLSYLFTVMYMCVFMCGYVCM